MVKALITEQKLMEAINLALAHDAPSNDKPCRVEAIQKAAFPDRNWEIVAFSTSGSDLLHAQDCDKLRQAILDELAPKYDVVWEK